MQRCAPCLAFVAKHRAALRRAAWMAALFFAFWLLGRYAGPAPVAGGFCRVYF